MFWILKFHKSQNCLEIERDPHPPEIPEILAYTLMGTKINRELNKSDIQHSLICLLNPDYQDETVDCDTPCTFSIDELSIAWLEDLLIMSYYVGNQRVRQRVIPALATLATPRAIQVIKNAENDCHSVHFTAKAALKKIDEHKSQFRKELCANHDINKLFDPSSIPALSEME